MPTSVAIATSRVTPSKRSATFSVRAYSRAEASKPRSNQRVSQLGRSSVRSRRPHIIGVSVSEITAETITEVLSTTANSLNNRPTTPVMNSSGMNTATSETVSETMVKPICAAPR